MPELLQQSEPTGSRSTAPPGAGIPPATAGRARVSDDTERLARDDLRRQIGALERELGELFATAFPRRGIEFGVPAAGGPRVVSIGPITSATAREHGMRVDAEAAEHSIPGLVAALLDDASP